jgi:hypothetical protein
MTFAIPPGERVFLRGISDKAREGATSEKDQKTVGYDTKTQPRTASVVSSQEFNDDAKIDTETPRIPAASKDTAIEVDTEATLNATSPTSKNEKALMNTEKEPFIVAASSIEEGCEMTPDLNVVVVSPDSKSPTNGIKRPDLDYYSESQPATKRKRGRPPKTPKKVPESKPALQKSELEANGSSNALSSASKIMAVDPITSVPESSASVEEPVNTEIQDETAGEPMENPATSPAKTRASSGTVQHEKDSPASSQPQDLNPISSQSTDNDLDDILVPNIGTPNGLAMKILQIDGRMPNGRVANGWKDIRCIRNNQDIGSLFDVREAWFIQNEHK